MEFETWLYRGIIGIALFIIWYFLNRLLVEIKEMNVNIKSISDKGIIHDGKLELVESEVKQHTERLKDHSARIRTVERKQDACKYCDE